jgi:hypothetical protein
MAHTNPKEKAMIKYLIDKAKALGYQAWQEGNGVTIRLPFIVLSHCKGEITVTVHNISEFRAIMGDVI